MKKKVDIMPTKIRRNSTEESQETENYREYEECGCETGCGGCKTGRCTVPFLNVFNNAKWALAFFCMGVFIQGMTVNGISSVIISTLERRFHLRSSETGFIASCYEIGVCISIPIVTYIGGRGHRPIWLGWGIFIIGVGAIVFSLPHFIAPTYTIINVNTFVCDQNSTDCEASSLRVYRGFFIVGQLLLGIGASPVYTLAINYLDENVKEKYSSTYHGIFFAFALLGPGAGFLLGGYFLNIYVNPWETPSVESTSLFWIGNWWIGFLIMGGLAVLVSVPIMMYPRQLPNTDKVRLDREKEMHQQKDAIKIKGDENFGKDIRDAPRCLYIFLKNPTLIVISISGAMDSGIVSAFSAFGAKYIETMFNMTSSTAAIYFGIAVIVSAFTGNLLSGILVSKFELKVPQMIKFCLVATSLAFACLFAFLIYCETPDVAGVNMPYNTNSEMTTCQSSCGCSTNFFSPICGADQLTYVSFCDAECSVEDPSYTNCSKVFNSTIITSLKNATATKGKCSTGSCPSVALFLFFGGLATFFGYLKSQSALQISLRSIPLHQRSFALGIQWLIMRTLGQIPLPIILGKILDLSCILWGQECGECGACKMYDGPSMSKYLTIMATTAKGVSLICLLIVWKVYKPPVEKENGEEVVASDDFNRRSTGANVANGESTKKEPPSAIDNPAFSDS
uniref:solute carrier organic anion transporter family member 4A1-like isoform X1 n=1 Tax=Styela clava TaxID=7725 RepID=UPI00193A7F73|nr:solute carrier organic anion transporter family member 4A1-like isoform X1 [Styela clava]XP_039256754.1 solute carrier organic anion transporter family member 4A1-like isoform X1 [Styela clava]